MEVKELVKALLWLAKDTEFVFAADTLRDSASAMESMQEELDRVKAELDAAIENLRGECKYCKYFRIIWNGCTPDYECPLSEQCLNRDMWQWRGLEGRTSHE